MLKKLFSSKIRIKLLTLFFTNPDNEFFLREIHRQIKMTLSAIHRELENLEEISLISSIEKGRIKYYKINRKHLIYPELKNIIYKTEAIGETRLRKPGVIEQISVNKDEMKAL